jgi:hypothetical protein
MSAGPRHHVIGYKMRMHRPVLEESVDNSVHDGNEL